ncbi:hypothetical protein AHAS_Ahas17G0078500 [Arachis hypogaea]
MNVVDENDSQSTTETESISTDSTSKSEFENHSPLEPQHQPSKKATVQQSEEEVDVNVCPSEPKKQAVKISSSKKTEPKPAFSLTSSVIKELLKDDHFYEISDDDSSIEEEQQPRQRKDDMPSFNLGISPPASQSTDPSEPPVSQLEVLAEAVVDAGVTATTSETPLPAATVLKTPEKNKNLRGVDRKVVNIHSMILNQIKVRRYQEQIYIVPLDIVNFMLRTHGMEYIDKTTNKTYRFDIEHYVHYRQFLDKRKLASHPFGEPLIEDGLRKEAEYIQLNGQRTNYDCGIYVMKWLETIDPQKIKSGKRYKYRAWTQKEIDDFKYQYGPNLLLHEMNKLREQVIWESEAIRLPKPSAALSSPYCEFTTRDLDSK